MQGSPSIFASSEPPHLLACRLVMDKCVHNILVGYGAHKFALSHGMKKEETLYPASRREWKEWMDQQAKAKKAWELAQEEAGASRDAGKDWPDQRASGKKALEQAQQEPGAAGSGGGHGNDKGDSHDTIGVPHSHPLSPPISVPCAWVRIVVSCLLDPKPFILHHGLDTCRPCGVCTRTSLEFGRTPCVLLTPDLSFPRLSFLD